jgi:hypothetical protein
VILKHWWALPCVINSSHWAFHSIFAVVYSLPIQKTNLYVYWLFCILWLYGPQWVVSCCICIHSYCKAMSRNSDKASWSNSNALGLFLKVIILAVIEGSDYSEWDCHFSCHWRHWLSWIGQSFYLLFTALSILNETVMVFLSCVRWVMG